MISAIAPDLLPFDDLPVSLSSVSTDEMEMPSETPPDSRVLIIRNRDRTFIPDSPCSLPPHCSLGMPYEIAAALAAELNLRSIHDPDRRESWHVVIHRANKSGYAVLRVMRSSNWIPQDEFDLPPNATELTFHGNAHGIAKEFNQRQMRGTWSPSFWAVHVKPLRKDQDRPKFDVSRDDTRVIRVNGDMDVYLIVRGVYSDRQAFRKLRASLSQLISR